MVFKSVDVQLFLPEIGFEIIYIVNRIFFQMS